MTRDASVVVAVLAVLVLAHTAAELHEPGPAGSAAPQERRS
jgi:hypothetical protein